MEGLDPTPFNELIVDWTRSSFTLKLDDVMKRACSWYNDALKPAATSKDHNSRSRGNQMMTSKLATSNNWVQVYPTPRSQRVLRTIPRRNLTPIVRTQLLCQDPFVANINSGCSMARRAITLDMSIASVAGGQVTTLASVEAQGPRQEQPCLWLEQSTSQPTSLPQQAHPHQRTSSNVYI